MILLNYNKQTGDFKVTVQNQISEESVIVLRKIKDAKESFRFSTLNAERELIDDEGNDGFDAVQKQSNIIEFLKDLFLVEEIPIYDKGEIKDWGYKLTYIGHAFLNIRDGKRA